MTAIDILAERVTRVRAIHDSIAADPLRHFRWGVPRLPKALDLFNQGFKEGHLRACNKGGKTFSAAAFVVACCQKRRHLDGLELPQWRGPVEATQLTIDYPQQVQSVRPAYLRALGRWPYKAVPEVSGAPLERLAIMPVGGNPTDQREWSTVHFLSQKNMTSGKGVRSDIVAFDEPPVMDILNELRKASHAGREGIRLIAETPIKRREWAPLREDYGDTPRRSIRKVDQYRFEVRWSLDDVADWVLSPAEKAELRAFYALQPALADAREHGDYANTDGDCPFDVETLLMMMEDCTDPNIVNFYPDQEGPDGRPSGRACEPVEIFREPEHGSKYYVDVDPASGVRGNNPLGILVAKVGTGDLCARWNGYNAPVTVGVLAALLGRQYNNAPIDIEMKDHWGPNVYRGAKEFARYNHFAYEQRNLGDGKWANEVGWDANDKNTNLGIGAIQDWLAAYRAGIPYAKCTSRAIIQNLLDAVLDARGKIVAAPGIDHGEDLRLWGRALYRCVTRSGVAIPALAKREVTGAEASAHERNKLAERIQGKRQPREPMGIPVARSERPRW